MARYLYGDYHVPLPELQGGLPPYTVIVHGNGEVLNEFTFVLVCSHTPYTAVEIDGTYAIAVPPDTILLGFKYVIGLEMKWQYASSVDVGDENQLWTYINPTKADFIWCNEDIKNTSNQVIFEGSTPVLYPEEPEDPEEPKESRDLRRYCLGIALELMKKALPIRKPLAFSPTVFDVEVTDINQGIQVHLATKNESEVIIDWGDGTEERVVSKYHTDWEGFEYPYQIYQYHKYTTTGIYQIKITETNPDGYVSPYEYPWNMGIIGHMYALRHAYVGTGLKRMDGAFDEDLNLQSCYIPGHIVEIGDKTFYECESLSEVNMPRTIKRIGKQAFYRCSSLPENLEVFAETLDTEAYSVCTSLRKVWIRDSVKVINVDSLSTNPFTRCDSSMVIYCEADAKPDGWSDDFASYKTVATGRVDFQVVWGQKTQPW